jgi:phosphoesterase RecJ-like protein
MVELDPKQTAQWLMERDGFLILTHIRPDGDTLGSAAALCAALRKAGKQAALLPNPGVTDTYAYLMTDYWAQPGAELSHVVSVDIATEGLFPENAQMYRGKVELCIDHHPSNEGFAPHRCLQADKASCGEIVLEVCKALGELDGEIADLLYTAVSTDTGCFVYGNTTADTHRAAAELLEKSPRYREINKRCFRTKTFKRLKMESLLVENMELYQDGAIAVVQVSCAMLRQVGATESDIDDLAAFAGQVEGVRIAVTIRELVEGAQCKISLRTDASLNATKTCALLGGGGHIAASGATVDLDLSHTKEAILNAIYTIQREG